MQAAVRSGLEYTDSRASTVKVSVCSFEFPIFKEFVKNFSLKDLSLLSPPSPSTYSLPSPPSTYFPPFSSLYILPPPSTPSPPSTYFPPFSSLFSSLYLLPRSSTTPSGSFISLNVFQCSSSLLILLFPFSSSSTFTSFLSFGISFIGNILDAIREDETF